MGEMMELFGNSGQELFCQYVYFWISIVVKETKVQPVAAYCTAKTRQVHAEISIFAKSWF